MPVGATIIGFADGIAVAIVTKCVVQVEMNANEVVAKVMAWLEKMWIELADHKTESGNTSCSYILLLNISELC